MGQTRHRIATAKRVVLHVIALLLLMLPLQAAAQGYAVRDGDVLQVEVVEDPSLNRSVLVTPAGTISFPFAGSVDARGRTTTQIQQEITNGLIGAFAEGVTPTVFVSVARLAARDPVLPAAPQQPKEEKTIDLYITGEINSPGLLKAAPGTTILQLIAQAGGLTRFAADSRILLRRIDHYGYTKTYLFDYDGYRPGTISAATVLYEGDVVVVPERRLFEFD